MSYDASNIPVLQLSLASDNLNELKLYDYGYYNLRQQLAPVHGVTFPTPDGGKYQQIMVDIDPTKLQARGLTPTDVVNAVNAQSLTLPSGLAKIGDKQYTVRTNAMPTSIEALNNIPIKFVNGAWVFVRDVAQVRDAFAVPKCCAAKRATVRVAERHQERQCFDARGRERCSQGFANRSRSSTS